ncbi:hypothetical protein J1614_005813 [Plenodomus biglobosus]|nr:hypothetical protein J1614_005813 [Plenodomus biglobosus]
MSAPNPGRQSPDPSHQTDAQSGQAATNMKSGGGPAQGAEQSSNETKGALPSNPKQQVLDQHAEDVTSKTVK